MATDIAYACYKSLAEREEERGDAQLRDRFWILAADAALAAGMEQEADDLRKRLLEANPHHMLKPYDSFADAMQSADVSSYIADLRNSYPLEEATRILATLDGGGSDQAAPPEADAPDEERAGEDIPEESEPEEDAEEEVDSSKSDSEATTHYPDEPPLHRGLESAAPAPSKKTRHRPRRPLDEEEYGPSLASNAVASLLFLLVLIAGLALGSYTLIQPFLQK